MMLTIILLASFLNSILGFLVYINNPKDTLHKWYCIFGLITGLWVLSNALLDIFPTVFLIETVYATGALVATSGIFWILYFCGEKLNKFKTFFLWILGIIFFIIPYFNNGFFLVNIRRIYLGGVESDHGPGFILYSIYVLAILFLIIYKLILNYKKSEGIQRLQGKFVLIGVFIWAFCISIVSFILPLLGVTNYTALDSPISLVFIVFTAYAITKHHLFDIKVIATEIFSTLLIITAAIEVFTSQSSQEVIYKIIVFIAVVIFAILLIRSVLKEVKHREESQLLNIQLEDANTHLKELSKMKSEFLAIASHQLRTPLTAIRGFLAMQADGDFDGFPKEKVKQIHQDLLTSANRLNNIVNDLLDAMEVESGFKIEFKPTQIEPLIEETITDLKLNYDKKGLYLKFEKSTPLLPKIDGEERYLREVFKNLIDNAEKYTKQGGTTITLEVSGANVIIKVQDTGIGVLPEDRKKLFDKFSRGSEAAKTHTDGSGLGLFIVKKIVDEHHGKVRIDSEGRDKGTAFVVSLPIKQGK